MCLSQFIILIVQLIVMKILNQSKALLFAKI